MDYVSLLPRHSGELAILSTSSSSKFLSQIQSSIYSLYNYHARIPPQYYPREYIYLFPREMAYFL